MEMIQIILDRSQHAFRPRASNITASQRGQEARGGVAVEPLQPHEKRAKKTKVRYRYAVMLYCIVLCYVMFMDDVEKTGLCKLSVTMMLLNHSIIQYELTLLSRNRKNSWGATVANHSVSRNIVNASKHNCTV